MTLEAMWKLFRDRVVPPNATPEDVNRARLVFYAGARTMFEQLQKAAELPEDAAELQLTEWEAEFQVFTIREVQRVARQATRVRES